MPPRSRATLVVEVDLAEEGELSTVNHWRMLLQRQLDDFAGTFRPHVRGQTASVATRSSQQTDENASR